MYNYYLSRAFARLGHQVSVVAARWTKDIPYYNNSEGVDIYRLYAPHFYSFHHLPVVGRYFRSLEQAGYSWKVAKILRALHQQKRIDVVEFAEVNAEGFFYLRQAHKVPAVVRCHTPTFVLKQHYYPSEMPYDTDLTVRLEKSAMLHADLLTAPSRHMASIIANECKLNAGRIQVVPNGLDVGIFQPPQDFIPSNSEVVVLHVGRLDRIKGIQVLAEAIPQLVAKKPNLRFVFIGEGRIWKMRLKSYFEQQAVAQYVDIYDHIDNQELLAWYRRAHIAAVPTLNYESFSYTCAQAMAARLPVVASDIGGIPETLGERSGFLIPPGNVDALVEAAGNLIDDPLLRKELGEYGNRRAWNFDSEVIARKTQEVYERLLGHSQMA